MKNNNPEINQEFEKLLKDRMNELSSSVDCFDRISAKAFPEKNQDFSESGFTVCDLENVTGKSKKPLFLKWTAIAVACAVCAVVIPKTSLLNNLIASFGKSPKKIYSQVIDEINAEISHNTYRIYDMPVEDYIQYDRLVTPLYPCPFKDCGKDNINVRVFVRTYNDIPTNQIYAVEYAGEYEKSNFIAVADTKAKFTDEDFKDIDTETESDNLTLASAVQGNFTASIKADTNISDNSENNISLASFEYENIFKSDNEEVQVNISQILYYGDKNDEYPDKYYYDINNSPDADGTWKNTLCFDGFSSMPPESESLFVRTPLFDNQTSGDDISFGYITPTLLENDDSQIDFYTMDFREQSTRTTSMLAVPFDSKVLDTLKMYFSKSGFMFSSFSTPALVVTSGNSGLDEAIYFTDDNCYSLLTEEEQEELAEKQKEMEEELLRQQIEQDKQSGEDMTNVIVSSEDYRF